MAISAWCVFQLGEQGDELYSDLPKVSEQLGNMASAFLTLANENKRLRVLSKDQKTEFLLSLAKSENFCLRIETARTLVKIDQIAGKRLLGQLAKSRDQTEAMEAKRQLQNLVAVKGVAAMPPMLGDQYELVLSIIEAQE